MVKKLYNTPIFDVVPINVEIICRVSKDVVIDADDQENWITDE